MVNQIDGPVVLVCDAAGAAGIHVRQPRDDGCVEGQTVVVPGIDRGPDDPPRQRAQDGGAVSNLIDEAATGSAR